MLRKKLLYLPRGRGGSAFLGEARRSTKQGPDKEEARWAWPRAAPTSSGRSRAWSKKTERRLAICCRRSYLRQGNGPGMGLRRRRNTPPWPRPTADGPRTERERARAECGGEIRSSPPPERWRMDAPERGKRWAKRTRTPCEALADTLPADSCVRTLLLLCTNLFVASLLHHAIQVRVTRKTGRSRSPCTALRTPCPAMRTKQECWRTRRASMLIRRYPMNTAWTLSDGDKRWIPKFRESSSKISVLDAWTHLTMVIMELHDVCMLHYLILWKFHAL